MNKEKPTISMETVKSVVIWLLILVGLWLSYRLGVYDASKEYDARMLSVIEETERTSTQNNQNAIMVVSDRREDGGYIKIQDRMSMDFSAEDVRYIYAFIDIRGGSAETRALNMVIMLNNIYDTRQSIKDYVTYHLGPNLSFEFKDVKADREAYRMVAYEHWDESDGARWFTR